MFATSKPVTLAGAALGTALLLLAACGEPAEEETQGSVQPPATEQAPGAVAEDAPEDTTSQQ
jgi:ABC-type oligopeptide transport system substrate-binding subunit